MRSPEWYLAAPRTLAQRYGFALLACAVAGALTYVALLLFIRDPHAIAALLAAIILTSWYAGTGPAALAVVLCMVVDRALALLLHRGEPWWILSFRDGWFVAFALAAAWFGAVRRRFVGELRAARGRLEDEVAARTGELSRITMYLEQAQELTQVGSWAMSLDPARTLYLPAGLHHIPGVNPATTQLDLDALDARTHPADRERSRAAGEAAIAKAEPFEREFRIVRPDGSVRYLRSVGRPRFDAAGGAVEYGGAGLDPTERRPANPALRTGCRAALCRQDSSPQGPPASHGPGRGTG